MIDLNDSKWKELEGGYKSLYDVSIPLKELEATDDPVKVDEIFLELWNELHHQGDVGLASYLALPQLIRIAMLKDYFDRNVLGICAVVEIRRHADGNPELPQEYKDYYMQGLAHLKQFVLSNIRNDLDNTTYILSIAILAITSGRTRLGKAIMELDDESILDDFLEQF